MAKNTPKPAKKAAPAADSPSSIKERKKRRRRQGRPAFVANPEQRRIVMLAAGVGLKHTLLCKLIINDATKKPIDTHTLRKHFREELDTGMARTHMNVGKSLYDQAVGIPRLDDKGRQIGWEEKPNVAAAIWFSKAKMGWKDRQTLELADLEAIIDAFGGDLTALRAARAAGDTGEPD